MTDHEISRLASLANIEALAAYARLLGARHGAGNFRVVTAAAFAIQAIRAHKAKFLTA